MSAVPFLAEDVDAVEAGRRACYAIGDTDNASLLSWLASRMRVERQLDMVQEAVSAQTERRIDEYGHGPHLRAVGGDQA